MRALGVAILIIMFVGWSQPAEAQFVVGAHAGYSLDVRTTSGDPGAMVLGGQAQFLIEPLPIVFNPSVDMYMSGGDEFSALQFDVNILVPFLLQAEWVTPYIGGGLAITRLSTEGTFTATDSAGHTSSITGTESSTDYGANILAGVLFGAGPIRPFATVKGTLGRHAIFADTGGSRGDGMGLSAGILVRISE